MPAITATAKQKKKTNRNNTRRELRVKGRLARPGFQKAVQAILKKRVESWRACCDKLSDQMAKKQQQSSQHMREKAEMKRELQREREQHKREKADLKKKLGEALEEATHTQKAARDLVRCKGNLTESRAETQDALRQVSDQRREWAWARHWFQKRWGKKATRELEAWSKKRPPNVYQVPC